MKPNLIRSRALLGSFRVEDLALAIARCDEGVARDWWIELRLIASIVRSRGQNSDILNSILFSIVQMKFSLFRHFSCTLFPCFKIDFDCSFCIFHNLILVWLFQLIQAWFNIDECYRQLCIIKTFELIFRFLKNEVLSFCLWWSRQVLLSMFPWTLAVQSLFLLINKLLL